MSSLSVLSLSAQLSPYAPRTRWGWGGCWGWGGVNENTVRGMTREKTLDGQRAAGWPFPWSPPASRICQHIFEIPGPVLLLFYSSVKSHPRRLRDLPHAGKKGGRWVSFTCRTAVKISTRHGCLFSPVFSAHRVCVWVCV